MPEIQVEPERAQAFLEKLGAEAEAAEFSEQRQFEAGQAAMVESESEPESWLTVASKSVEFTAAKVCPAWELTADEKAEASHSVAGVLDHYFPGAVQGFDKWHPLSKLAGTMFFIVALRIDLSTGRLAPLHYSKGDSDARDPQRRQPDTDNGDDPERQNSGHFATHGE